MDLDQVGNKGVKDFLSDMILRAEDVLGKMIYKLTMMDTSIGEMVSMINSVFALVNQWEDYLKDISIEMLDNIPPGCSMQVKSSPPIDESKIIEQVSKMESTVENGEETNPVFVYSEQPLKQYNPGCTGRCVISSVGPKQRLFCMVDLNHSDCKKLFAIMQNMPCKRLKQLPPPGEVFGIYLEGSVFRAVRNKPIKHAPLVKAYIRLIDTGEILPYDAAMPLCSLAEYYRNIPGLAICCKLVYEHGDLFGDDADQYLKTVFQTTQYYRVVSVEKAILFVKLSRVKKSEKIVSKIREESSTKRTAKTPGQPRSCMKGSSGSSKVGHPPVDNGLADNLGVPPIGSKIMLIPKFIRDVQHMWCQVVLANDITVEANLKEMELRMNLPQNSAQFKKLTTQPVMAQKVFVKYKDARWYRAEVVRYFDEMNVSVFYVDRGHADMVSIVDICQWDERYSYLPYQAILCRLSNVVPMKRFHKQAVVEMNRALLNKRFCAHVVANTHPLEIIVYDQEGFDISVGLVITGMAKRIKNYVESVSSEGAVGPLICF